MHAEAPEAPETQGLLAPQPRDMMPGRRMARGTFGGATRSELPVVMVSCKQINNKCRRAVYENRGEMCARDQDCMGETVRLRSSRQQLACGPK